MMQVLPAKKQEENYAERNSKKIKESKWGKCCKFM